MCDYFREDETHVR